MRRMFVAVTGVALGLVLMTPTTIVRAEQAQDVAVLDKTMKTVGPAFAAARKAIGGGVMADAKASAEAMSKAFVETEAFFKSHSKAEGEEWAQAAKKASDAIASAADAEAASAAVTELGKTCATCHAKYRDKAADGTYMYKPGN